jgi:hypothetical protein
MPALPTGCATRRPQQPGTEGVDPSLLLAASGCAGESRPGLDVIAAAFEQAVVPRVTKDDLRNPASKSHNNNTEDSFLNWSFT